MASYSLQMQKIGRSSNRSATAAAAYRAGVLIDDARTGERHDYRRKSGVEHTAIFAPSTAPDWASDRAALWNAAEVSEKRKNSVVAREFVLALPHELDADARHGLASEFAQSLVDRYGVAADLAIHAPGAEGDHRNHHAHLMITTRRMEAEGLTAKTRELDDAKTGPKELEALRASWAEMQNAALERAGRSERVDHRSLEEQSREADHAADRAIVRGDHDEYERQMQRAAMLDRAPEPKLGPAITALERKAQREAEETGRAYQPATELGAQLVESRATRSVLGIIGARLDAARAAYSAAREEEHRGPAEAFGAALRAMLAHEQEGQERAREAHRAAQEAEEHRPVEEEGEAREKAEAHQRALEVAAYGEKNVRGTEWHTSAIVEEVRANGWHSARAARLLQNGAVEALRNDHLRTHASFREALSRFAPERYERLEEMEAEKGKSPTRPAPEELRVLAEKRERDRDIER